MRSKRMRGGSLMCFTKPGAWLPAQRSAALCSCLSTKRASLPNLCSEPVLELLPRWKPPKPMPSLYQRPQQTPGGFKKFAAIYPNRAAALSRRPGGARGLPRDKRCQPRPRRAPGPAPAPPERALGPGAQSGVAAALRAGPAPCAALRTHPRSKIKCLPLMISNSSVWLMACKLPPVPSDLPDEAPRRLVL